MLLLCELIKKENSYAMIYHSFKSIFISISTLYSDWQNHHHTVKVYLFKSNSTYILENKNVYAHIKERDNETNKHDEKKECINDNEKEITKSEMDMDWYCEDFTL